MMLHVQSRRDVLAFPSGIPLSDFSDIPSLTPPPGVTPNFVDPETNGQLIVSLGTFLLVLTVLFLALRVYAK